MRSPGDSSPASTEAIEELIGATNKRNTTQLKVFALERELREKQQQLREMKQGVKDAELEMIALYNTTDLSLEDIADVVDLNPATIWRKAKALRD